MQQLEPTDQQGQKAFNADFWKLDSRQLIQDPENAERIVYVVSTTVQRCYYNAVFHYRYRQIQTL